MDLEAKKVQVQNVFFFFPYCIFVMIAELKKDSLILKMNDDFIKLKESLSTM